MKTTRMIQNEIDQILKDMDGLSETDPKQKRKLSKLRKKNEYAQQCLRYIESNPSEQFLEKQRSDIQNVIDSKMFLIDRYNFPKDILEKEKRTFFKKEMGIDKMEKQVETLTYLLD